ncbi:MAG: autoinducer binding domain-containing protein [Deltaproteobacteria bacterium]|nr:autoinducer binding domain-containing protein [Deltaproteobacteria bacterium]
MNYKDFTKKELAGLLDIIQECVRSRSDADVANIVAKIKGLLSADNAVCALGDASTGSLVKILNLDYPEEWGVIYISEELYRKDPVIRYNYEFYRTHLWSEAVSLFNGKEQIDLMNRATDFGLTFGLSSGVNGERCRGSIFSFSARQDRFEGRHKKILDVLTPHVHQALVRALERTPRAGALLSEREKEVLVWMKEGKTNWEISTILRISERTVKFHVQNIERKLNAVNKAHAIAIAFDSGLVSI